MDELVKWNRKKRFEKTAAALEKNGFDVRFCETAAEAADYLIEQASSAETVGFGGSVTLAELDIVKRLESLGKKTLVHGRSGLSMEERLEIMRKQQVCDLFLTGTNAVTLQGFLVNIDATGNRVGAMTFGPRKVIVVAGANKLTSSLDDALRRIKDDACPPNARRLGFDTPCAHSGVCTDCNSPQRICRITTIFERCPRATDMTVCLVNEDLGF